MIPFWALTVFKSTMDFKTLQPAVQNIAFQLPGKI